MPHKSIHIVNGKLVKPKRHFKRPDDEMTVSKSTTQIAKQMVEDKGPEMQFVGEGFNAKTFILQRPASSVARLQRPKKVVANVNKQVNNDLVTGLGLLNFGSSLQKTKSKNIKLII
jgi:hypothetical protein